MTVKTHIASYTRPVRRRLGLVPTPTKPPRVTGSSLSDLFVWRSGGGWSTFFEGLNIAHLLSPLTLDPATDIVTINLRSEAGKLLGIQQLDVPPGGRRSVQIAGHIGTLEGEQLGTFSVSHSEVPSRLASFQTYMTDRGYCGYSAPRQTSRAYAHGNLDSVAHSGENVNPLGVRGLKKQKYTPQYVPQKGVLHEFAFTNPTARTLSISVLEAQKSGVRQLGLLRIAPFGAAIQSVIAEQEGMRYVFVSRMWLLRPIIFVHSSSGLDVFHG